MNENEKLADEFIKVHKEHVFQNGKKENTGKEIIPVNEDVENKLKECAQELESFSYSVSHDLRAPLRAINGYATILEEDYSEKIDLEGIRVIQSIIHNSKKMGELIDGLLTFFRLGKKELLVAEINMTSLVKSVQELLLTQNNENQSELIINELPSVKGDQILIKQVWVNLISNAIKFSKHKPKPIIEIGALEKDDLIVYYVKDNGVGFDMQYSDKLFGVFQRLHSNEEFEGTGIGLAIVQKIVRLHNGSVWVESKLNEGTCFYFSLPRLN